MKKEKKIILGMTLLLICSIIISIASFWTREPSASPVILSERTKTSKIISLADPRNIFYQSYISLIIPSDGLPINKDLIVQDTSLKMHSISNLTNGLPVLIFRYSYMDCNLCVKKVLQQLHEKFDKKFSKRVILITDSYSKKDFKLKATHLKTIFPVFNINSPTGLGLPIEGKNLPFLFVLTPDFKPTKIFIPFKEYPQKTSEYLTYIYSYFKLQKQ